jgi:methyl-accepting chemotaxis protein
MCTVSLMCRRIATPFMVLLFALAGSPGAAQPARLDCLPLLQERLKLVEALNKLESVELPSDKIRDMQAFVAELKSALGDTGTDAATAAKKIEDAIDKIKRVLPQAEGPLKQIAKALKDTKASIEEVLKPIDAFGTALDIVDKFYQQTES